MYFSFCLRKVAESNLQFNISNVMSEVVMDGKSENARTITPLVTLIDKLKKNNMELTKFIFCFCFERLIVAAN
jgi:hypothetical protein